MEVRQISVFLENKAGQLAQICRILADAQIDMKALNIAETSDYGVLRLITDKPLKTLSVLTKNALVCTCSDVVAVKVPDQPGGLASVLEVIAQKGISIEYMYSMMSNHYSGSAVMVFQTAESSKVFADAGLAVLDDSEVGINE